MLDTTPSPGDTAPPPGTGTMNNRSSRAALLSVRVPAEAKLFVNGLATRSTGSQRRYVSNGLRPGFNYTYELRASVERDGKMVEETKVVQLQAGQTAEVAFGLEDQAGSNERTATKPVKTSLLLRVPADAKVFLSGNESKATGNVRSFVTTKLQPGQSWDNYVIRVELERNGQKISKEETISLASGESRELAIELDAAQVAQAQLDADRQ